MRIPKFLLFLISFYSIAQTNYTIKGHINNVQNKEIALKKYNLNQQEIIELGKTNDKGDFKFDYPANYIGAALIEIKDSKSVIVLLNNENFEIQWNNIEDFRTLKFTNSIENSTFNNGIEIHQNTDAKLVGLNYLIPLYESEIEKKQFLIEEVNFQNKKVFDFYNAISEKQYVKFYLKIRKLLADLNNSKNQNPEKIIQEFNSINLADQQLINSGLYFELLDAYFLFLENYSDEQYDNLISNTDSILKKVESNPTLKQNIAEHLFSYLEKKSLTKVSQHLALNMLSNSDCKIDGKLEALFEQYRKMAIGNTAPKIQFANSNKPTLKFENIKNRYKLIVFGASWCQRCIEEMPKLKTFYDKWKKNNDLEIIFISLDNDLSKYKEFTKSYTWISSCDSKGWESQTARDYFIFASPTMFLLDTNNKILLKPISAEQISSWLEK